MFRFSSVVFYNFVPYLYYCVTLTKPTSNNPQYHRFYRKVFIQVSRCPVPSRRGEFNTGALGLRVPIRNPWLRTYIIKSPSDKAKAHSTNFQGRVAVVYLMIKFMQGVSTYVCPGERLSSVHAYIFIEINVKIFWQKKYLFIYIFHISVFF